MKTCEMPTVATRPAAVILANGEFPRHEISVSILSNAAYLACCDGAINQLLAAGIRPDAIVGDGDSLDQKIRTKYADIIRLVAEQETNDQTKTVMFCIEKGLKDIIILGGCGKREDHTLGNISLLAEYLNMTENICMITNYGVFNPIRGAVRFESFAGQQVSLFAIDRRPLTVRNLKYPVEDRILDNWWQGTLNESQGDDFVVEASGRAIVFRLFPLSVL
ncbi:MAG: thiamine diphosphokinase [Prevotella sp.]|jgi:thiamine pyrophosphokinase|nr:thiamine diphosphokinase [Prevotella sp.]